MEANQEASQAAQMELDPPPQSQPRSSNGVKRKHTAKDQRPRPTLPSFCLPLRRQRERR
jgi:hypothetical protein